MANNVMIKGVSKKLVKKMDRKDGTGSFYSVYIPNYGSICVNLENVLPIRDAMGREIPGFVDVVLGNERTGLKVSILNAYGYTCIYQPVEHIRKVWDQARSQYIQNIRNNYAAKIA